MSRYGKFDDFCRDSGSSHATIPVCNLFDQSATNGGQGWEGGCNLEGISMSRGRDLANLGIFYTCAEQEGNMLTGIQEQY
jgi:hypothetical protein